MTQLARRSRWLFFALFALFTLALAACSGAAQHTWLEAPGWSRARLVGETEAEFAVPPAVDAEGNTYFLLVTAQEEGAYSLKLVKLDANAAKVWEKEYPVNVEQGIENPRVFWTRDGLQLLWIESDVLYSLVVDTDGEQVGETVALSNGHLASSYEAAVDADGELMLMYSGLRAHPGLYLYTSTGSQLLDEGGYAPQLEFDEQGGLHSAWLHGQTGSVERQVYYIYAADGNYAPGSERVIFAIRLPVTSTLSGFGLGLDSARAYVFWSELTRTGLGAGGVDAKFVSFPYEPQGEFEEQALFFPNGYHLTYTPYEAGLLAGERAQFEDQGAGRTSGLSEMNATPGSSSEIAIAFKSRLPYLRNKTANQVGVVFLQEGIQTGSQLLSFNSITSERPAIISDEHGYLYASFLGGGYPPFQVYYAGTSPAIVNALNTLDNEDFGRLAADTSFGLLSGFLLVPFILAFGLLPVLFLFFTGTFRREGEWITARGTAITLGISIFLYYLSKIVVLPDMVNYVPFSAWIPDIPANIATLLRFGVPLLSAAIGFFTSWRLTYARERTQPLFFLLIFIILDGFITIGIYGVIFYNAF